MKHPSLRSTVPAYTLVELMVSAGVIVVLVALLASVLLSALTLFAKNYSINDSHAKARNFAEKIELKVHQCVEPARLIDKNGAAVAGNGPAAGISCLQYMMDKPCFTSNAVNLNTKTVQTNDIATGTGTGRRRLLRKDFKVKPGDLLMMPQVREKAHQYAGNGSVIAEISAVQVNPPNAGPNDQITAILDFANNFGSYFEPAPTGLTTINPDQPFFLLTRSAFIAVPSSGSHFLRFYPSLLTVSSDGQAAFDNPANFRVIAELDPLPSKTASTPFNYSDPDRRVLDVNARTISRKYNARLKQVNTFIETFHTAVAYRSAIQKSLQPN